MISSKQIVAARVLLGWNQEKLANVSDIGITTIRTAEKDVQTLKTATVEKIQEALTLNGIEFLPGNGVRERDALVITHKGEDGIIALWDDIYTSIAATDQKEILIANSIDVSEVYSPRVAEYLDFHLKRLKAIGAFEKIITVEGDEELVADIAEYRTVPEVDFCDSPTFIYADKIALLKWGPPARITIVHDPMCAESVRKLFGYAWKHARTPERTAA